MFGKNQILKVERRTDGALDVHSVFYTIQGEGPEAGRPAVFVRLHGCSLACSWCDTEFEAVRNILSPAELIDWIKSRHPDGHLVWPWPLVVLTGGEPMRQNLAPFISAVTREGYEVQIETAGIHWQPALRHFIDESKLSIVCSPKVRVLAEIAEYARAFKYIVAHDDIIDESTGLPKFAVSQQGNPNPSLMFLPKSRLTRIYVQPRDDQEPEANRLNLNHAVALSMRKGYRLSLQQHKILNLP